MQPRAVVPQPVALAIIRRDGLWLVARRPRDVHLGGLWEFPGGKCETGETPAEAAVREALEECGVVVAADRTLASIRCDYGDRVIDLAPVACRWVSGEARPLASEECGWVTTEELRRLAMPEVNAAILEAYFRAPA
ncbi:CTP pyrophosphohydrolase [Phycisphaerae bacterium RAS1]|nr:CTP pyrophosphohydrolase [Phycisphaerae bacterium RAS1]